MHDNTISRWLRCHRRSLEPQLGSAIRMILTLSAIYLLGYFQCAHCHAQNKPQTDDQAPSRRVDFQADILPILKQSCLECHGGDQIQGNLDLRTPASISKGGFTGLPITGNSLEQSELYQRLISEDEDYRMPKSDSALAANQVALIAAWIEQGGEFSRREVAPIERSASERLGLAWLYIEKSLKRKSVQFALFPLVPLLLYWLYRIAKFAARRRNPNTKSSASTQSTLNVRTPIVVSTFLSLAAMIGYQQGELAERQGDIDSLSQKLQATTRTEKKNPNTPPLAPHPMHPPRLGGVYYRGNDERNSRLFNNGFYRTAELRVDLVDESNQVLKLGDAVPDNGVSVRLNIRRALGTENGMFDKRTLDSTFISSTFKGTADATDRKTLQVIEQDQEWEVTYRLADQSDNGSPPATQSIGDLYVYYGPLDHNRIHYVIHYDLDFRNGRIGSSSEIWMASTYNLEGRVLIPNERDILLDRWFDFRPIPEIPNRDSSD